MTRGIYEYWAVRYDVDDEVLSTEVASLNLEALKLGDMNMFLPDDAVFPF